MGYGLWAMGYGLWAMGYGYANDKRYTNKTNDYPETDQDIDVGSVISQWERIGDYKKLEVWKLGHELACDVYRATDAFPRSEAYGLAQLRRAAASIPANVAEGSGRRGDREFDRFVLISLGSATELEYHLLLSRDVDFLDLTVHDHLSRKVLRVQAMLAGLHQVLKGRCTRSRSQPIAHGA
jgi:four helix bundle protein